MAVLLLGCSLPLDSPTAQQADAGISGQFLSLAWATADDVITSQATTQGTHLLSVQLARISLSTREVRPVPLPNPPGCLETQPLAAAMVDRRVVADRECLPGPGSEAPYHELVTVPLDGSPVITEARVPWSPDSFVELANGAWLAAYGPDLCGWIDIVPDTGLPLFDWPIVVRDDGAAFAVNAGRDTNCDGTPLAGDVALAPDGTLAFVASGAARSESGFDRLQAELHLYLREPDGRIDRIADGLVDPRELSWNPAGTQLVASATIGGHHGIWRFDRAGVRTFLYAGDIVGQSWSPDGSRVAVLDRDKSDETYPPTHLVILSPSESTSKAVS